MSSAVKKVSKGLRKANFMSNVADKVGVSKSNAFRQVLDPLGKPMAAAEQGGVSGYTDFVKSGGATDQFNLFHKTPDNSSPEAPPELQDGASQGNLARDRIRRRAYRAQGRSSTIRSQSLGSFGSGAQLLGS